MIKAIRERARRDLHAHMSMPAIYVPPQGGAIVALPVRIHEGPLALDGEDRQGYLADHASVVTRVVILNADLPKPVRLGIFSIEPGIAYRIQRVPEEDGITRTMDVTRLTGTETDGLPLPGEV